MRTRLVALAALFACTACPRWTTPDQGAKGAGQRPPQQTQQSSELSAVAELEDRRSFGAGRLLEEALTHRDALLRRRAMLALGRIQDPAAADTLLKGLGDPDPGVRGEAAFAIGLLGLAW